MKVCRYLRGVEKVTCDVGMETRRDDRGCARGFELGKRAREEVDERRHDDDQRHSGGTLVKNTSIEHGRSQVQLRVSECSQ